jgi:hypothetical protein
MRKSGDKMKRRTRGGVKRQLGDASSRNIRIMLGEKGRE